ncbi:MAG: hypothetical protein ACRD50_01515 [Candidatus Acidiferrales bacterium]
MTGSDAMQEKFSRLSRSFLLTGTLGLILLGLLGSRNTGQLFRSWLFAYVFWIGIPVGSIALVMLHHMSGGRWGVPIRRILEAAGRTFPVMALLFLPILAGVRELYPWTSHVDDPTGFRRLYLSAPFFTVRTVIYFLIWFSLAYFLSRWSLEQDRTGDPRIAKKLEALSAPGLILYGLAATYSSVDWVMSLEPNWSSTIYGMWFMVIGALTAMAFAVFVLRRLVETPPLKRVVTPQQFNDLGNLLLAFVMLWAYLGFSQFLLIWAGNLKDEIPWYLTRARGSWAILAVILIIFHFVIPFVLLLSRGVKRRLGVLSAVAGVLIFMSLADVYWLVVPAFEPNAPRVHPLDLLAVVAIGGLWLSEFFRQLKGKLLVPAHDPNMEEVLSHGD